MTRFRWAAIVVAVLALLVLAPIAAAGGSPHFIKNATQLSTDGPNLVVSFKEAGLSAGSTETITLTATQFVTYECVNGGGKNPSASNKHSFFTTTSVSGEFTADKNGNIVGSLVLAVAPDNNTCPPGQTDTLVSVTYSNIQLVDSTSGASLSFGGSITYTNPNAPVAH